MERTVVLSARIDLLAWARSKGPDAMAAADRLAKELYAHGSEQPPKTRQGLLRALEELRDATQ